MRALKTTSIDSPEGLKFATIEPIHDRYAILSHTWDQDEDEVVYTDILNRTAESRSTYSTKLAKTCRRAIADGFDYVWIDTCCIDKSSSAELSEAINSMFRWYRSAAVCYVLLSDVPSDVVVGAHGDSAFCKARWFRRGFTLQELLAPPNVVFYSQDWTELGTKASLSETIASITTVDVEVLVGSRPIESASIANRMGWAANRQTKRPEDVAYCLMGIFSVNMPLLYGEGAKAFIRLQEEIMKSSTDHTLFAWIDREARDDELRGVLATSPSFFKETRMLTPYQPWARQKPYSMTNLGLSMEIVVNQAVDKKSLYIAGFDCPTPTARHEEFFGILLRRLNNASKDDLCFARIMASKYMPISPYQYEKKAHVYLSVAPSLSTGANLAPTPLAQDQLYFSATMPHWRCHRLQSVTIYPGAHHHRAHTLSTWPVRSFYLRRGPNLVSCALQFKCFADTATSLHPSIYLSNSAPYYRLLILIGTGGCCEPAFSVTDLTKSFSRADFLGEIPALSELELLFKPVTLGESALVGDHLVQISLQLDRTSEARIAVDFTPGRTGKAGEGGQTAKWRKFLRSISKSSLK